MFTKAATISIKVFFFIKKFLQESSKLLQILRKFRTETVSLEKVRKYTKSYWTHLTVIS